MTPQQLPTAPAGSIVALDGAFFNRLMGIIASKSISVTPPLIMTEGPGGGVISLAVPGVPQGTIFRVNLTNTGGSNGSQSAAASYTYTAKTLDNNTTLGTVLGPEKSRPNGTRTAATKGTGYYNLSGTFVLWEADEPFGTGHC